MSKYIGKDEECLTLIREQLSRRAQIEEMIRMLKAEKEKIKKMEAVL